MVPGSHEGPLFDQYNDRGEWVGCLAEERYVGTEDKGEEAAAPMAAEPAVAEPAPVAS